MRHTVTEHTLSTGTKGLLIDVPGSEVVSLQVYFKAGYQFGDFTKYDIPHLIEHYVFSGTKGYPGPDQIAVEIGRNGAYLSASTNDSSIRFVAECAEFEVEHILELMTELITRPIFPPKVYETERENVRTELTSYLSNYNREVSRLSGEASFPKRIMNYNKRLEQLDGITRQDVIDYYQATFHARNAVFLVSGAVKAQQATIQRKLEELFGELPVGQPREFIDEVGLGIPKPLLIVESIDSVYFNLNWFNAGLTMEERAAGTILGVILTGSYASRIFGKARERGITYHVSSGTSDSPKASSLTIQGFCNQNKWEQLLELIAHEVSDIVEHGPSKDEVADAKQRVIGRTAIAYQTAAGMSGWYGGLYFDEGQILSLEESDAQLRAVTPQAVQKLAKYYFASERHNAALVGKVGEVEADAVDRILKTIWS